MRKTSQITALSAKSVLLLTKALAQNGRVILIGDIRQLSAVESGNPFKSLQMAGIQTAYLEESRRRKTEALRTAVVCLNAGEQREGLGRLDQAGMVHEVSDVQARHYCIVNDYMSLSPEAREKTLIVSGMNVDRLELTANLREALQGEGRLGADMFTMRSLRFLDRSSAQIKSVPLLYEYVSQNLYLS